MSNHNSYNPLVGDFVFEDLDADGIQDSNEPGIANVEVKLLDGHDNSVVETTFTDANGQYAFWVNPHNSGGYKIMFNNPDDSVYMFSPRQVGDDPEIDSDGPMSDVFHLSPFAPNDTIDAGLVRKTTQPQAGIDIEKATNGQDADSPTGPVIPVGGTATFTYVVTNTGNIALSNVEVIDDAGTPNHTGDDFHPHFTGGDSNNNDLLDQGETWTYEASRTVTEGQYTNKGKVTAHDPDGNTVMDMDPSNHFGEPPEPDPAKLGDFVFEDLDQDGIQDSNEPGIAGAEVKLQNPSGQTLATTTTDNNGMYMFSDLTPGDYKVMFTQPNGFDSVSPFQAGNNPGVDSDADPNNGLMSDVVSLSAGENNNTIDAGFFNAPPEPAKLGDFVFEDLDQDGIQDSNEPGIGGVTVKLQNPSGQTLETTTTDNNGMYMFSDLTPGDYKVMFTQPSGFDSVSPFQAGNNPGVDSDADPNNGLMSDVVSLSAGENNNTIDAGFFNAPPEPAKLGDFVFEDLDADGIQDSNEPGIAGAEVKLQSPNGQTLATTTTDSSGMYMFSDLTPGDYKVMFTQPSGFNGVSPFQVGNNPGVDSDADPNNGLMSDVVTLSAGEFDDSIDAGFFKFATLGDKVFNDLDRDGRQDSGEPGISGVTVKLQDSDGEVLETTTTNGNGIYEFSDLIPGDYKVMFNQPNGFEASPFEVGNNPAIDSDANPNNGLMSDVVTLSSGETDNTLDGGFFQDIDAAIDIEKLVKVSGGVVGGGDDDDDDGSGGKTGSGGDDDDDYDNGSHYPGYGGGDDDDDDNGSHYPGYGGGDDDDDDNGSHYPGYGGGDDDDDDNGSHYPGYGGGDDDDDDGSSGDPNKGFLDADDPPGPDALEGSHVEFKYVVTNPGETDLDSIKVTDDKLTPDPLTNGGFNVGDQNKDGLLNPGEKWIFTASETAKAGLQTNIGSAMGTPVDGSGDPFGLPDVTDSDPANYTGIKKSTGGGDDDDDDGGFSHFIIGDDDDDDRNFSKYLAGDDDDSSFSTFQDVTYGGDQSFSYLAFAGD